MKKNKNFRLISLAICSLFVVGCDKNSANISTTPTTTNSESSESNTSTSEPEKIYSVEDALAICSLAGDSGSEEYAVKGIVKLKHFQKIEL